MVAAVEAAQQRSVTDVELWSSQFPEDRSFVPPEFTLTPDLDRSILDLGEFQVKRKLPFLTDILQRLYDHSDADWLIYTNVDIALQLNFYVAVTNLIDQGYDAFAINRRTISTRFTSPDELDEMYADKGTAHGGYDCFVFHRRLFPLFDLGLVALGLPKVDRALLINMVVHADNPAIFRHECLTFHIGDSRSNRHPSMADLREYNRAQYRRIWSELRVTNPELDVWKPQELERAALLARRVAKSSSTGLQTFLPQMLFDLIRKVYRSLKRDRPELADFDARLEVRS